MSAPNRKLFQFRHVCPSCPTCKADNAFGLIPCPLIPNERMYRTLECLACGRTFVIETFAPDWGKAAATIRDVETLF